MWVKENGNNSTIFQTGKYLVLTNVSSADRGLYVCFASVPPRNATDIALEIVNSTKTDVAIRVELYSNNSVFSNSDTSVETNVDLLKTTTPTIPAIPATPKNVKLLQTETLTKLSSSSSSSLAPHTIANSSSSTTNSTLPTLNEEEEQEYQAILKVNLTVRTPPGPVSQLYFKASTILGFLIWRFNKTAAGGYPVRSFTAEYRNVSYVQTPYNSSFEHAWIRMDPINIAPNVRQMEVYHLEPNTTYEFRIWANNVLGSGEVVTTNVTTLPETKEEELLKSLASLIYKAVEDGWDSIELIPNIILNPGFCESTANGGQAGPYTRTIIFGEDDDSDDYDSESDHEPTMEKFKRKVSVFFTGPTIKRI
ncbi:contactin-1a [Teleopsis dalmanni]|uniref:contactin-1a n=1 Tax=Teleopsis dalmanni TaxID=139649 RepID=UPI0018CF8E29|nr:contactin-1a [Teleopsis dalmanni]